MATLILATINSTDNDWLYYEAQLHIPENHYGKCIDYLLNKQLTKYFT